MCVLMVKNPVNACLDIILEEEFVGLSCVGDVQIPTLVGW